MPNTTGSGLRADGRSPWSKGEIDASRTGEEVTAFDPAAAPLGTDDEAAGQGASADAPGPRRTPHSDGMAADTSGTARSSYRAQDRLIWPMLGALVLVAGAVVLLFYLLGR